MKPTVTKTTDRIIKGNLKRWYNLANEESIKSGLEWYKEAQEFSQYLSNSYRIDTYTAATVISCLSPNNKWDRNKYDAEQVIKAFQAGKGPNRVKVCTYNNNKVKAFKALQGLKINKAAPKTHAFAMNVGLLDPNHITIDKWHLRACLLKPKDGIEEVVETCTNVQYKRIEQITAKLAKDLNLKGYELQAIIWVTIKNEWNR